MSNLDTNATTDSLKPITGGGMHRSHGHDHPVKHFFKVMLWALIVIAIFVGVFYFIAMTHWHMITCTVSK